MGTSSRVCSRCPGPWEPGPESWPSRRGGAARPRLPGWTPELHAADRQLLAVVGPLRQAAAALVTAHAVRRSPSSEARDQSVRGARTADHGGWACHGSGDSLLPAGGGAWFPPPGGCTRGHSGRVTLATLGRILPAASLPLRARAASGAGASSLAWGCRPGSGPAGAGRTSVISLALIRGGSLTPGAGSREPRFRTLRSARPLLCPGPAPRFPGCGPPGRTLHSHFLSGTGGGQRLDRACGVACLTNPRAPPGRTSEP